MFHCRNSDNVFNSSPLQHQYEIASSTAVLDSPKPIRLNS